MVTEVASGAVVYRVMADQPEYLLLKSATSDFWGFPKGHVEGTETLVATAEREIREETKLTVTIDEQYHDELNYDMANGHHKTVHLFVSQVPATVDIDKQDEEIASFGWFKTTEAVTRLTYDNLKSALERADRYIRRQINNHD